MNILHVTDLHIDDVNNTDEKLRDKYYEEFLDDLSYKLGELLGDSSSVDFIVTTGDYVNKGKVENFPHAEKVLKYLASKLNIKEDKIYTCIGNHDILIDLEKRGKVDESRKHFKKFADSFVKGKNISGCERATFYDYDDKTIILSLDSLIQNGTNVPDSNFTDNEIDNLIHYIKSDVKNKALIVLSHYPMIKFDRAQYEAEDIDWEKLHYWKKSYPFVERLVRVRENKLTLYFFGDGHIQDFKSYNDYHHFHLTGMIGGDFSKRSYQDKSGETISFNKTNDVRLVRVSSTDTGDPIKIHSISYETEGYMYSPHTGIWEDSVSKIRLEQNPFVKTKKKVVDFNPTQDEKVTRISSSVESKIMEVIRVNKLYKLGRHVTTTEEATLGWVSMNGVFADKYLLDSCVIKGKKWIKESIKDLTSNNTFLIGVDFWGSILASQISVISGVSNYSIMARSEGKHHDRFEDIEAFCKSHLESKSELINIVLITDVIGTGKTINYVKKRIEELMDKKYNFFLISVITDLNSIDTILSDNFIKIGIYCSELKLLRLSTKDLPDEDILPAKTDFR
jgi:hypoxanthine phosphoribosyltransferase